MLNRHYGWASPYTSDSNRQKRALTDAELPRLGTGKFVQIAQNEEKNESENQDIVVDE